MINCLHCGRPYITVCGKDPCPGELAQRESSARFYPGPLPAAKEHKCGLADCCTTTTNPRKIRGRILCDAHRSAWLVGELDLDNERRAIREEQAGHGGVEREAGPSFAPLYGVPRWFDPKDRKRSA